jgi:O-acetyl-ADP-ribose deacetylase (regulator of RNase III)
VSVIKYVVGNAVYPEGDGPKFIIHICNDDHRWGRGFVAALSERWGEPERSYRRHSCELGRCELVPVESDIAVINMVAQHGTIPINNIPPIRYEVLEDCLEFVRRAAMARGASVHAPRIGAGLAGGKWDLVEELLLAKLVEEGVSVTIYDLLDEG